MKLPRRFALLTLVMANTVFMPSHLIAHPLGNESVIHFSILRVLPDRLEVDLILDIAEGPAAVIRRTEIDADHDNHDTIEEQKAWLFRKVDEIAPELLVKINGQSISLKPIEDVVDAMSGRVTTANRMIVKVPGVAGMPTYRLIIRYMGTFPALSAERPHVLYYEDTTFVERPGLMRIILDRHLAKNTQSMDGQLAQRGDGSQIVIQSPRPPFWDECTTDPLIYEQYDPSNLPRERKAAISFRIEGLRDQTAAKSVAASGPAMEISNRLTFYQESLNDPRNDPAQQSKYQRDAVRLLDLLRKPAGLTVFLTITVLCFAWGAAHALMPGHAKTLVAAYLISQRGTWWHAVLLAIIVTITHTALVVVLGVVIWAYQKTNPELGPRLQLWLGTIAGLLIAGMGLTLIWRAITGRAGHYHHHYHHQGHAHDHNHTQGETHVHIHDHEHDHVQDHSHDFTHHHHPTGVNDQISVKLLLVLGITGGIVPCPTATIIMFLGIGANLVVGALYAVGVFSLGLALTLMGIGFLALYSRRYAGRLMSRQEHEDQLSPSGQLLLLRLLPALSGTVVLALGVAIAAHYIYYIRTGLSLFRWIQW